jgi:hypothetical protein
LQQKKINRAITKHQQQKTQKIMVKIRKITANKLNNRMLNHLKKMKMRRKKMIAYQTLTLMMLSMCFKIFIKEEKKN